MLLVLVALGIPSGVLTTVAGQGGGLALLLACSSLFGPRVALALTTPALLVGNLHRAGLFRRDVSRSVATQIGLGAVPGAIVGGLLAGLVPPLVVEVVMVALTLFAVARAAGLVPLLSARVLVPAGAVFGLLTGTAGGAGVLLAPLLLASGLTGASFVGTSAVVSVLTHLARLFAYGSTGLFRAEHAVPVLVLVAALLVGNALGERLRRRLSDDASRRLELVALVACVALSLALLR